MEQRAAGLLSIIAPAHYLVSRDASVREGLSMTVECERWCDRILAVPSDPDRTKRDIGSGIALTRSRDGLVIERRHVGGRPPLDAASIVDAQVQQ
jgi:hypothetical protein